MRNGGHRRNAGWCGSVKRTHAGQFLVAVVVALSLAACQAPETSLDGQPAGRARGTVTHAPSGMRFPDQVDDFRRVALLRYDDDGLDVSVGYNLMNAVAPIVATVYVYPAPVPTTGRTPATAAAARERSCREQFSRAKAEVAAAHLGAELIEEHDITLPRDDRRFPGKLASYAFDAPIGGARFALSSQVYVFCHVGGKWGVKYRFTWPRDSAAVSSLVSFMTNLPWTIPDAP